MNLHPFSLSVIIPAYNEAGNIALLIEKLSLELEKFTDDFEILIVDDGSHDETYAVAQKVARANLRVRVLQHKYNQGWGAGLRTGFTAARKEWVIGLPADNQFEVSELQRFIDAAQEGIAVIASRRLQRKDPGLRCLISKCFNWSMRTFYGIRIHDINWVKMFRREIFQRLPIEINGFVVDTELMAKAQKLGYRIREIRVTHRSRFWGASTTLKIRRMWKTAREVLKIPFLLRRMKV